VPEFGQFYGQDNLWGSNCTASALELTLSLKLAYETRVAGPLSLYLDRVN